MLDGASLYMRIYFLGMPGNMLYNFGAAIMRSVGDTKRPLYYLSLAGVINIILNIVTVAAFGMGVAGVALATIVSQYISAALVTLNLIRSHGSVHLDVKKLRIQKPILGGIMKIGLPAGFSSIIFSISNVMIQSSINAFGENAIAGSGAASQLESFVYTGMNAVSQAALSFTGQNIGAQRYDRISKIMRTCSLVVVAAGVVVGSLVTLLSEPLLHMFINEEVDPAAIADVVHNGQIRLEIICLPYFIDGLMEVFASMLRGMGSAIAPTVITVVGICGVRILWLYTIFAATTCWMYSTFPIPSRGSSRQPRCCSVISTSTKSSCAPSPPSRRQTPERAFRPPSRKRVGRAFFCPRGIQNGNYSQIVLLLGFLLDSSCIQGKIRLYYICMILREVEYVGT